jgi:hypothetical protein
LLISPYLLSNFCHRASFVRPDMLSR